jgi:hypothetical protein
VAVPLMSPSYYQRYTTALILTFLFQGERNELIDSLTRLADEISIFLEHQDSWKNDDIEHFHFPAGEEHFIVPFTAWLLDYPAAYVISSDGINCLSSIALTLVSVNAEEIGKEIFKFSFPTGLETEVRVFIDRIESRRDITIFESQVTMHSSVLL